MLRTYGRPSWGGLKRGGRARSDAPFVFAPESFPFDTPSRVARWSWRASTRVPFTGFLDESTRARQFWRRAVREASHDSRRSVGRFLLFLLNPEDPRAGSVPFRHSSFRNAPGSWFGSEPQQKNEAIRSPHARIINDGYYQNEEGIWGCYVTVWDAGHYHMISVSHTERMPTLDDIADALVDPDAYV